MDDDRYFPKGVEEFLESDELYEFEDENSFMENYRERKQMMKDEGFGELNAAFNSFRGTVFFDTPAGYPLQKLMEREQRRVENYDEEELEHVEKRGKIGTLATMGLAYGSGLYFMTRPEIPPEYLVGLGAVLYLHVRSEVDWKHAEHLLEED